LAGAELALAANDAGDNLAHLIVITPSGSVTGDYVITGTGPNGQAQSETVATDTTNAVTSTLYFLTVTSVTAPAGIGSETVDIGWAANSVTPWRAVDPRMTHMMFGCRIVTGSPTFTLQHSMDPAGGDAYPHAQVTDATAGVSNSYAGPIQAIRLLFTVAGRVRLSAMLAGKATD